jgi:hypothetical protein
MGLQQLIAAAFSPTAQHERLAAYVARQAALGRRLAQVLADPYVVNRAAQAPLGDPRCLLDDPVIAAAIRRALAALDEPWPVLTMPERSSGGLSHQLDWAASAWSAAAGAQAQARWWA